MGNSIIIGAGVAGLSTGCYGQMNGYRTQIFEMHITPGLENFYMAGQWVEPATAMSGRNVTRLICEG